MTRLCLNALLARPPTTPSEIIVVDDASRDLTQRLLAGYGDRIRVVTHASNSGFATSCNDGAAVSAGEYLVFLNNDTLPTPGWLDALVRYADAHPRAAVVGSKLLNPDGTVQHAGVVVCQDRFTRELYPGFPSDHPAVNRSRRVPAVTGACMLVRRDAFQEVGGFDTAFENAYEDHDLCLRLGESGYEVHYCHESELCHLRSVTRAGRTDELARATRLFQTRWSRLLRPDDLQYFAEDGLIRPIYDTETFPIRLAISPLLGVVEDEERERQADRLLQERARQVHQLLQEKTALEVKLRELELRLLADRVEDRPGQPLTWPALRGSLSRSDVRDIVAGLYLEGSGIELGALDTPVEVSWPATVRYVDRMTIAALRQHYPELDGKTLVEPDIVDDGERLASITDASQDFVIANHFLEHCQDPIGALQTIMRVLKPGGIAYLAVPDKRFTFDHRRPITTLDHLVRDHEEGPAWSRRAHYEEWAALAEDENTRGRTAQELLDQGYSIHFHVWTQADLMDFLTFVARTYGLAYSVELMLMNQFEVLVLLRKDA